MAAAGNAVRLAVGLPLGFNVLRNDAHAAHLFAAAGKRRVVVWSEGTANVDAGSKKVYPNDVNAAIAELPKEREGRYWYFLTGAVGYAALLVILSHFEKGG